MAGKSKGGWTEKPSVCLDFMEGCWFQTHFKLCWHLYKAQEDVFWSKEGGVGEMLQVLFVCAC